jgi:uncharacterized protein with von Willebrand factor type A (vWA) domain
MADIKELGTILGLKDIDLETADAAAITEKFNSLYVSLAGIEGNKEVKSKIEGAIFGGLTTKLASTFGIASKDLRGEDGKNLPYEKLFEKVKTNYESKISELEESAGKGGDEAVQKLTKKLTAKELEIGTLTKSYETLQHEKQQLESEFTGKFKGLKVSDKVSKAKATVLDKLAEDYHKNELVREGFENKFNATFDTDLDENDNLVIKNKATGELVKSKTSAAKVATFEEVYLSFAEDKGIMKKNNGGSQKPPVRSKGEEDNSQKQLHPNAQKRAQA